MGIWTFGLLQRQVKPLWDHLERMRLANEIKRGHFKAAKDY